jgi:hypothetical protein
VNVLIVQQLAWALRIGHEVAKNLKGDGHTLAAMVHGLEAYRHVRAQSDVAYKDVLFVDPLYDEGQQTVSVEQVREIETRYGVDSVWRLIYGDRVLVFSFRSSRRFVAQKPVSDDYALSVCWRTYQAVRRLMDGVRPDVVLAPVIGSLANYLLYLEARHRGIPCFTIGATRFDQNLFIADDLFLGSRKIAERFDALRTDPTLSPMHERALAVYQRLRRKDGDTRPTYMAVVERKPWSRRVLRDTARDVALLGPRLLRSLVTPRRVMGFETIWLPSGSRWHAARNVLVALRERFRATDSQGPCHRHLGELDKPFVYFPLHFEPELTLLVFAPEYANQLEVCRRIALSLPAATRLVVKEHPAMVASRPAAFYDALRGLPNVDLVHSSVPSHELFNHPGCRAVVVISSTVGFEAAMNGRAVVMLGPGDYGRLPAVYPAVSLDDAVSRLRQLSTQTTPSDVADVDRPNLAYICAQLEESFSFDYFQRWTTGGGQIDPRTLVSALSKRVRPS